MGLFSKWPMGEYSRRRRVGLSTSMRASPERTMADWWAVPSAMSTGVERFDRGGGDPGRGRGSGSGAGPQDENDHEGDDGHHQDGAIT